MLKIFVVMATVGLLVWAAYLPDDDEEPPLGWVVLSLAVLIAALALVVLRLFGRSRPLIRLIRRLHGHAPALEPAELRIVDSIELALDLVCAVAFVVFALGLLAVGVAAIGWHARLPVAVGVVPFSVLVGGGIGLWLIGRGEFPGGG